MSMNISASQMSHFDQLAEQGFVQRLEALLVADHAQAVAGMSPPQLRQCVVASLARGRAHGFASEVALVAFAVMMFEIGPGFDRHPAFARALEIRVPDEVQRVRAIYANTTDEDWEAARPRSRPEAWAAESAMPR